MKVTRWGILGCAKIAKDQVIPAMIKSENTKLLAIASRDKEKAADFSENFSIERVYESYEKLISDPEIDAIYIPLPNHLHVPWSIKCLEAGKHVLCEKPISIKSKDVLKLFKAEEDSKKIIAEAFMVRFHPQWIKVKKLIGDGKIGKLKAIQGLFNYYNIDPDNIRNDNNTGGGGILDIGVYPIITSRFITGLEPRKVVSSIEFDPKFKTDILTSAILLFDDIQMSFTCSTQSHLMQHMRFIGTEGRLELPVPFNPLPDEKSKIYIWNDVKHPSENPKIIEIEKSDQYKIQIEAMNYSIQNKTPFPFDLEDSYKNMKIIDAIINSSKSGKWEFM